MGEHIFCSLLLISFVIKHLLQKHAGSTLFGHRYMPKNKQLRGSRELSRWIFWQLACEPSYLVVVFSPFSFSSFPTQVLVPRVL